MISVIIPYKNAARWIGRCVDSLRAQRGEARFIFVDDNSTDDGGLIAISRALGDERFIFLINERSPGVSGARNTGMDAADGAWITFLDADDEMLPDAIDIMTRAARRYDAEIFQFNHRRFYTKINKEVVKYTNPAGVYTIDTLPRVWFGVWNKLYKAALVEDLRFVEGLQYGEDGLFNLACLARARRLRHQGLEETTVRHRFDNRQSLSKSKTARDLIQQVHAYEDFMLRQEAPAVRLVVCEELARLWGGATFRRSFGEEYEMGSARDENRGTSAGSDPALREEPAKERGRGR